MNQEYCKIHVVKAGVFIKFITEASQQPGEKQMKKTHWLQKLLQVNGNEIHGITRSNDTEWWDHRLMNSME